MPNRTTTLIAAGLLLVGMTACTKGGGGAATTAGKAAFVGVVLPESSGGDGTSAPDASSPTRWDTDRRVLEDAFKAAGVRAEIRRAPAESGPFRAAANDLLGKGVTVLMVVSPGAEAGREVLESAKSRGVRTIDYHRLTTGGTANYFVGFDAVRVGRMQADGLADCLKEARADKPVIAQLYGPSTDPEAVLTRRGYDEALRPKFDAGEYIKGPDQVVPSGPGQSVGEDRKAALVFGHMMAQNADQIDGVIAADDQIAAGVISVLRTKQRTGVPVAGANATRAGLRAVLLREQCMTVYEPAVAEAEAAARTAIAMAKGQSVKTEVVRDTVGSRNVPSVLVEPKAVDRKTIKEAVAAGVASRSALCSGDTAKACTEVGIS